LDEFEWYKKHFEGRWSMTKEQMKMAGPTYDFSSFRG